MRSLLFFIAFFLCGFGQNLFAQNGLSFLKDLTPLARGNTKYTELKMNSQPKYYMADGQEISKSEAETYMHRGYTSQDFVDKRNTEIKAVVFLPKNDDLRVGSAVPGFTGTATDGTQINLNTKGKVYVLNFWATSCKPCIKEMPDLNNLKARYNNRTDIVFVGLAQNTSSEITQFLQRTAFTYHQVPVSKQTNNMFSVISLPVNMVVDKNGVVQYIKHQYSPTIASELGSVIDGLVR